MSIVEDLIEELTKWVGTPYVTRGYICGSRGGTTCGHYFVACMIKVLPRGAELEYSMASDHKTIILNRIDVITPAFEIVAYEVPLEEMRRGDAAIFKFFDLPMQPNMYLGDDQFIYCTRAMGVQIGPLPSNLRGRIMRVYRWKDI